MAKTRSKGTAPVGKSAKSTATETPSSTTSRYSLPEESESPPQLFILPKKATQESRVVTLQNPRYSKPTRYLACPESGIYEFAKIAAPGTTPRSWLLENGGGKLIAGETEAEAPGVDDAFDAHILQDADLYVASPIDPLFLALPALLATSSKPSDAPKRMFLSSDDHFDAITQPSNHLSEILRWPRIRKLLESRMAAVCDTVEAGDESMFRLNEGKLLVEIMSKAKKMSDNGLPSSMEEKFVTKPLEAPFVGTGGQYNPNPTPASEATPASSDGIATPQTEVSESQLSTSSTESAESSISQASTAATSVTNEPTPTTTEEASVAMKASDEVIKLQRLRVAFNFICSSYIAPPHSKSLREKLAKKGESVDFTPLDDYVSRVVKLRQDAAAVRSLTDYSRKRNIEDEDERAEKRRKKEEDDKRKKPTESRGVKNLKKVDVKGMKKMSDFFKKK